jgi:hypothetical protein
LLLHHRLQQVLRGCQPKGCCCSLLLQVPV